MLCCFAAVLPAASVRLPSPWSVSGCPRRLCFLCRCRPRPPSRSCRGGAAAGPHFSLFDRLRYDPVVEDDFALAVPHYVREIGVAGDDLGCNATRKQTCPAQDHEAPVQRCAEEFFHEPEGVTP